jgi:hypothetical protein
VDLIGIEPMTSSMPWKRAPSCATGPLRGTPLLSRMLGAKSNDLVYAGRHAALAGTKLHGVVSNDA